MDNQYNQRELPYTHMAKAMSFDPSGPMDKTLIENRLNNIKQQKYQYYEGSSGVVGSPFRSNGYKNQNFTSPSFVSNSVFYEHSKNLSLPKEQMYQTTNRLHHSYS